MSSIVSGDLSPFFWDSPPFVVNLQAAAQSFPALPRVNRTLSEQVQRLDCGTCGLRNETFKSQRWAYKHIVAAFHPPALALTIRTRLSTHFGIEVSCADLSLSFCRLASISTHCAMCVIKSWAGAWTTSTRMHEATSLQCIFGCPASSDSISHYLKCGRLWRAVAFASGHAAPPDAYGRLALMCRSNDLLNLVVAFTVYHTVKSSHLDVSNRSIRTRDFSQLASVTKGVALAACRRFKQATQCRAPRAEAPIPEPHFIIDTTPRLSTGTVSSTIFVQGGDHFMTTTAS